MADLDVCPCATVDHRHSETEPHMYVRDNKNNKNRSRVWRLRNRFIFHFSRRQFHISRRSQHIAGSGMMGAGSAHGPYTAMLAATKRNTRVHTTEYSNHAHNLIN